MSATTTAELKATLTSIRESDVPEPRPVFVAALEQRLRVLDRLPEAALATPAPRMAPTTHSPRRLALATAALVVIGVLAALVVGGDGLRLRTLPGPTGVASDAGESAEAGGATEDRGSASRRSKGNDAGSTPASPTGSAFREPTKDRGDAIASATPSTVGTAGFAPDRFALRGSGTPARTFLDWDRYDGSDFAAYLVLRSLVPDQPQYPTGSDQRTLMMLRIESRDTVTYDDTCKVGETCRYRIVVVDRAGRELATSGVYETQSADVLVSRGLPRLATS